MTRNRTVQRTTGNAPQALTGGPGGAMREQRAVFDADPAEFEAPMGDAMLLCNAFDITQMRCGGLPTGSQPI